MLAVLSASCHAARSSMRACQKTSTPNTTNRTPAAVSRTAICAARERPDQRRGGDQEDDEPRARDPRPSAPVRRRGSLRAAARARRTRRSIVAFPRQNIEPPVVERERRSIGRCRVGDLPHKAIAVVRPAADRDDGAGTRRPQTRCTRPRSSNVTGAATTVTSKSWNPARASRVSVSRTFSK